MDTVNLPECIRSANLCVYELALLVYMQEVSVSSHCSESDCPLVIFLRPLQRMV
jgi:hypothetical protein